MERSSCIPEGLFHPEAAGGCSWEGRRTGGGRRGPKAGHTLMRCSGARSKGAGSGRRGDGWQGLSGGISVSALREVAKGPGSGRRGWIPYVQVGWRAGGRPPYPHSREAWCKLPPWLSSFGLAAGDPCKSGKPLCGGQRGGRRGGTPTWNVRRLCALDPGGQSFPLL